MAIRKDAESDSIDEQLRSAIKESGLPVSAVAAAAGLAHPIVTRFVNGERSMRIESAAKLARYFGMKLTKPKKPAKG